MNMSGRCKWKAPPSSRSRFLGFLCVHLVDVITQSQQIFKNDFPFRSRPFEFVIKSKIVISWRICLIAIQRGWQQIDMQNVTGVRVVPRDALIISPAPHRDFDSHRWSASDASSWRKQLQGGDTLASHPTAMTMRRRIRLFRRPEFAGANTIFVEFI